MSRKKIASIILLLLVNITFSQVGIGTSNPNNSAALEIVSTNSGLLIPRIALTSTTDVATIASPATSLLVYNTTTLLDVTPGFYYFDGIWKPMGSAKSGWNLTGNAIPLIENEFLGTTNSRSLIFKVNNEQFAKFHPNGGISLGKQASSAGQNATAIGFEAKATQSNSIILGSSANSENKIGIGTNIPTERLHIDGSVRIVDGTQAAGRVLTSDANGRATWTNPQSSLKSFASIYFGGTTDVTLAHNNVVEFGSVHTTTGNISANNNNIRVSISGRYSIQYKMTVYEGNQQSDAFRFNVFRGNTIIPGSLISTGRLDKNDKNDRAITVSGSVIVDLVANDQISLRCLSTNNNANNVINLVPNGCSLSVELVD
jgi:hypothetical protein